MRGLGSVTWVVQYIYWTKLSMRTCVKLGICLRAFLVLHFQYVASPVHFPACSTDVWWRGCVSKTWICGSVRYVWVSGIIVSRCAPTPVNASRVCRHTRTIFVLLSGVYNVLPKCLSWRRSVPVNIRSCSAWSLRARCLLLRVTGELYWVARTSCGSCGVRS